MATTKHGKIKITKSWVGCQRKAHCTVAGTPESKRLCDHQVDGCADAAARNPQTTYNCSHCCSCRRTADHHSTLMIADADTDPTTGPGSDHATNAAITKQMAGLRNPLDLL